MENYYLFVKFKYCNKNYLAINAKVLLVIKEPTPIAAIVVPAFLAFCAAIVVKLKAVAFDVGTFGFPSVLKKV